MAAISFARLRPSAAALCRDLPRDLIFASCTAAAALLALYLAMALNLDTPHWAAWTVLTVSLPSPDHAFSKSLYRMIGTLVGAAMGIIFIAAFAQTPLIFSAAMALWAALCVYIGTRVRQYQTYALALTWLTTGIVAYASVADPGNAFTIAVSRTAEVTLGVVCAGLAAALFAGHRAQGLAHAASPVPGQAMRNAVRAALAIGLASLFWYVSQWQNGPDFVLMSGAATTLFAAHPSKLTATLGLLRGFLLGTALGLFARFILFAQGADFFTEALILLPFLILGGLGVTDPRTQGPATGYNLAFMLAADPANRIDFDLGAALNTDLAMILGVLFSIAAFLGLVPIRELLRRRPA
ncbi:FUSC family protein [Acidiphilium sp. AL]|uniref:FUSC family protein n=1 Tax=Acidiphilium iwatense TaxID=768198 RepID=A0ABS9DQS1_9PROT|nr:MULTISPECIES: FUSC family protein [Acidiphilium]MCF3945094.1 FUSC family protein [Acidiphilium iwatense]MCU4160561.1 FUSC family protein [Acidiphilium sp. AL]